MATTDAVTWQNLTKSNCDHMYAMFIMQKGKDHIFLTYVHAIFLIHKRNVHAFWTNTNILFLPSNKII